MTTASKHQLHAIPIGTGATGTRNESDSMGQIDVPAEHYWGAQTQRSLIHFSIGDDHMPKAVYHAYGYVKKAAALVNADAGRLEGELAEAIAAAADEMIAGKLDSEFPLYVWQTGSGTQSNMNVNEVIGNRASQLLGGQLGTKHPVHPNDHVNMGQSSNDTFPTAMHIAILLAIREHTLPQLGKLVDAVWSKAVQWVDVVKIGRTHLQDAVPLTVGQEWSGWATQLRDARGRLDQSLEGVHQLAAGGTAVGTGINVPDGFGEAIAARLAELTGLPLQTAPNKFAAQGSLDAMVGVSAGLRGVAVALMKIANDMRWLASGPRAGLHELKLPANEPGSSIMPGKVNPTQQEAMVMVCLQVIGEDSIVAAAGAQGNFELNAMRPIIINNVLHSARILGDASEKLRRYSIEGTELDQDKVTEYVGRSLMLVTALSPHIGYDKASAIAHKADDEGSTLREAAIALGVPAADVDRIVDPKTMVGNPRRDLGLTQANAGPRKGSRRPSEALPGRSARPTVAPMSLTEPPRRPHAPARQFGDFQLDIYFDGLEGRFPKHPVDFASLERNAEKVLPWWVHSYVAGGCGDEHTQRLNVSAFRNWGIVPRMLNGAYERDLSVSLFGMDLPTPLLMSPIGVIGICAQDFHGDLHVAEVAAETGVPMIASTLTMDPMEDVAGRFGATPGLFQLYTPRDRDLAASFVERAERAGFKAIVVTLDTWETGWRPRDLNGASFPQLRGYCLENYFSDETFLRRLSASPQEDLKAATREWIDIWGNSLQWDDLDWLRSLTDLPIALKGICHPDDARRALDHGIDAIYCSNHGGRQANGGLAAIDLLPDVVAAAGDAPVIFDSGVRSGTDVAKALAMGATAVGVGRPYAYALAVGGTDGVVQQLKAILGELDLLMAIDGYPTIADLRNAGVRKS